MSWKGYNKKQNEYFNRILDLLMDETIISGSELKFPFLSQGTKSKDLYNQFFPHPKKHTHFINNPLSPNLTTMSYKIGEYMKEVYGVTDEEVGFLWDLYRERIKSKLNKFLEKQLPDRVFQIIQDDLFERTVKIPSTNKPLCTGGERVDYRDFDDPVDVSANQEGAYDQPNLVIQLYLPSSEFPYNVEMGRGRAWGQLNDYLKQQYGLTDEECQRVWDEYRGTICKNAKLPFVNESKSFNTTHFNFLEKVSQTMANNTPIYYKEDALHVEFPYFNIPTHETYRAPKSKWGYDKLHHYDTQIQSVKEIINGLWQSIGGKIIEIFGLTYDEADIIYKWYQELLKRKTEKVLAPIFEIEPPGLNESNDTTNNFLNKIVTHLLKHTKYDEESDMVVSPTPIEGRAIRSFYGFTIYHEMLYDLRQYLREIYGLTMEESNTVWSRYQQKLRIYNVDDNEYSLRDDILTESKWKKDLEDEGGFYNKQKENRYKDPVYKAKQEKVLDYALQEMGDNTQIEWSEEWGGSQIIKFPFSIDYGSEGETKKMWIMIDPNYNLDIAGYYKFFKSYVKEMYGMSDFEAMILFPEFENIIGGNIKKHKGSL